jgi:cell wall-associated NlpC family hydrolase
MDLLLRDEAAVARVLAEATSWLLTPWIHGAAIKGVGVDCARLLKAVYMGAGVVDDFPLDSYPADWMLHRDEERFQAIVAAHCIPVEFPPLPGDLALWRYFRCFSHGGIVIEWPRVIHAHRPERAVVWGDASKRPLADRAVQFWRPRGLA